VCIFLAVLCLSYKSNFMYIVIFERGLIVVVVCGVVCWASAADVDIVG